VVGRAGLGPLIGRIHAALPQLRVHLVGHSFGARLVSYTLAGLPDLPGDSPVKAVTLLEGAFSHNVFADPLPYDQTRKGDLAGMLARIDGPLVACFSSFDSSVGTMYPLASFAARQDTAGLAPQVDQQRWGGMGSDGVQGLTVTRVPIGDAGPGTTYPFAKATALNIDASRVVRNGNAPAGAHSDIVHGELTRVVLLAGGLLT
jgi:pimeloyl-ACP methyl ester carboxylesterase